MKLFAAIATVLTLSAAPTFACAPPIDVADCALPGGAGSSGIGMGAAAAAVGVFFAIKLAQYYDIVENQHRKITQCEATGASCGTPAGNAPAWFYSTK